jgi:hypothetical protein
LWFKRLTELVDKKDKCMEITRYMFFFLGKSLTNGNLKKEEGVR